MIRWQKEKIVGLITTKNLERFANGFAAKAAKIFAKITDIPQSLPANGGNAATVNDHSVNADVPSGAKFTDTVYIHPTTEGYKHVPSGGVTGQILRWSAAGTAVWGSDNNTTYNTMKAATASAAGAAGLVPVPAAGTQSKFLRGDGTWQTPANTTYSNMAAASANAAGRAGLVPAPAAGKHLSFLRGDGTWSEMAEATDAEIDAIIAGTFK